MTKSLITGCEGFIGAHLADLLVAEGHDVHGTIYDENDNLRHLEGIISTRRCDMKDRQAVEAMVEEVRPDYVFHLAAQSFVTVSWENPEETLRTNILGTLYLFEAIRRYCPETVTVVVGSSSVYGPRDESELPLKEATDFRPTSMYGVSKVSQEMLAYFYWQVVGLNVVRVRPFNMTGPKKTFDACSDFARGIAEIEKGRRDKLLVGNLETVRDFTDGRDAVRALWMLARTRQVGKLFNLCSGRGWKMRDILAKLIELSGRDIQYEVDPQKLRAFDDPIYIGDSSALQALGWKPETPMEKTLEDLLNWWREVL